MNIQKTLNAIQEIDLKKDKIEKQISELQSLRDSKIVVRHEADFSDAVDKTVLQLINLKVILLSEAEHLMRTR